MANSEVRQSQFDPEYQPEADLSAGYAATAEFLDANAENLGRVFGIPGINISVAPVVLDPTTGKIQSGGWATNLETGEITADPKFFLERGYTPDMAAYATVHEVAAHLREIILEPSLTRDVRAFVSKSEEASIFHNILADIAGNNYIHATLDTTKTTAATLYSEKLFTETDYTDTGSLEPRHLQFLYKIIRDEMIPGSETKVFPEVDALIDELRDFRGSGDLIKYSTAVAGANRKDMPADERFKLWTKVIYPKYLELLEQDKQDKRFQSSGDNQSNQDGQPSDQSGQSNNKPDFSQYYKDYKEQRHPEPMSEEEHREIHRDIEKKRRADEQSRREALDPEKQLDKTLQAETGHSLRELKAYRARVDKWLPEIQEMRDIFRLVINERVSMKRRLVGGHSEGPMLNPETVAQTVIDVRAGIHEPAAFMDYEKRLGEKQITGKTDWVFIIDRSGSMQGKKSEAAAASTIICLEGLSAMQRDIARAEEELGADLDLDIRTALYTFNHEIDCPKPLSHDISEKERLDTYVLVANPDGGNADSAALKQIEDLSVLSDRRQNLVVISDGEADDTPAAAESIHRLRTKGWNVFGIAVGSEEAEKLYAPDSRRVDDPKKLPDAMKTLIESNI